VQPLSHDDVAYAATLHAAALQHGFFGRLGPGFLVPYYGSFVSSPHAVAMLATKAGSRAGVLVGTVGNAAHYAWVLRHHGVRLAWHGLVALLARPSELAFFLRTRVFRYLRGLVRLSLGSRRPGRPRPGAAGGRTAVLTHVAVDARRRGGGVGAALVEAFTGAAVAAGCDEACLVTLAGPDGAGEFYKCLGWQHLMDRRDVDGRGISVFGRSL
jgi:GNAT superfamily N-acetyltransferase